MERDRESVPVPLRLGTVLGAIDPHRIPLTDRSPDRRSPVLHDAAGRTDADRSEFNEYGEFEDKREPSDIASVEVAHVERVALAN